MGSKGFFPPALFRSLRRLSVTAAVAVTLPSILLCVVISWLFAQNMVQGKKQEAARVTASAVANMANYLEAMTAALDVLSRHPSHQADIPAFYRLAKDYSDKTGYHLFLTRSDGQHVFSTRLPLEDRTAIQRSAGRTMTHNRALNPIFGTILVIEDYSFGKFHMPHLLQSGDAISLISRGSTGQSKIT